VVCNDLAGGYRWVCIVLAKTGNRTTAIRRNLLGLGPLVDVVGNKKGYSEGQISVSSKLGHYLHAVPSNAPLWTENLLFARLTSYHPSRIRES
jgi:hypothetical protein